LCYALLFNQLQSQTCDISALQKRHSIARAELLLKYAAKFQCARFLTAEDIVNGNSRKNLLFISNLFHHFPGIKVVEPQKTNETKGRRGLSFEVRGAGTREERAFRCWITSLGFPIRNLSEDLKDGLVILKIMNMLSPGIVPWQRVNEDPQNQFQSIENCTLCVMLGKMMGFSLVGIGGNDIYAGKKTFLLALIWQLMRCHVFSILKQLKFDGKEMTERDMIAWANAKVSSRNKLTKMESFRDPSLRDGRFLIDLVDSIKPGGVDYSLVTLGQTAEECMMNAQYVITVARKIGCCIFLLWEDIVDIKPRMILTLVGTLMSLSSGKRITAPLQNPSSGIEGRPINASSESYVGSSEAALKSRSMMDGNNKLPGLETMMDNEGEDESPKKMIRRRNSVTLSGLRHYFQKN